MIENISYDEILEIKKELKDSIELIESIVKSRKIVELDDFLSTVEGYSKYLETRVRLYKDADNAIAELASSK